MMMMPAESNIEGERTMTSEESNQTSNQSSNQASAPRPRVRRRWLTGLAIMLAAGALSFSVARAQGVGDPSDAGGGPFAGEWGGGGGGGAFMHHRMARLLDSVGASDGQKAQIKAVWDGLRPQLKAAHLQHAQIRQQMAAAMTAANIDTNQVEQLRRQSVQSIDRISSLITQGMVSSAQVLTPAQRQQVLSQLQQMRQRHHWHGGGGQPEQPNNGQ
jgi:Spy/CpxP family protein refolding chaperone